MFKKRNSWLMIGLVCLIFGGLTCLLYEPFSQWLTNSASLKEAGFSGALMLIFAVVLQIVIAFLPGEPLEIMAGVLYGSWLGLLLCLIGALLGSIIIYILVKKLGLPFVAKFFKEEQISQLHFLKNEQKLFSILFFIFFLLIPCMPAYILCIHINQLLENFSFYTHERLDFPFCTTRIVLFCNMGCVEIGKS